MVTMTFDATFVGAENLSDDQTVRREPVIPDEFDSNAVNSLKDIFSQLRSLWNCGDPEEDCVEPSPRAFGQTLAVIEGTAYSMMQNQTSFPRGHVITDDDGGIRIEWWHERSKCVTLVIGATEESEEYVFVKLGEDEGEMNNRILPARLAEQLGQISHLQSMNDN